MVHKKTHEPEEKKRRSMSSLLKNSLLAGGLVIAAACAGNAAPPQNQNVRSCPAPPRPLDIRCNGTMNRVGTFEGIQVGLTERAGYRFIITELTNTHASADVWVPVVAAQGNHLASMAVRFNEVGFTRENLIEVVEYLCAEVEEQRRRDERAPPSIAPGVTGEIVPVQFSSNSGGINNIDIPGLMRELISSGFINRALANITLLKIGIVGEGTESAFFRVDGRSQNEMNVSIEGGRFNGQRFRLDRRLDYSVDVLGEGFISIPMRLETLVMSQEGYSMHLGLDCQRKMEIDMGPAVYAGPACR
ncbi:MAG: hypothetical protein AB1324_08095 [Candidatus Micrarchaeota archaeon]